MNAVCANKSLSALDLSGSNVERAAIDVLRQNPLPALRTLNLQDGKVDGRALMQLARENSGLVFDLATTDVDADTLAALGNARRLAPPAVDLFDTQQLLLAYTMRADFAARGFPSNMAGPEPEVPEIKGVISPRVYAPDPAVADAGNFAQFAQPDTFEAAVDGNYDAETSITPPMSLPALIGYAIGSLSKTLGAMAAQGEKHVVEY
jgi:hypothetical protein